MASAHPPEASPAPPALAALRALGLPVLGWVLYDLANTIFAYAVLTRYLNEWIVIELGQPDFYIGLMYLGVSLALVPSLPWFGALADASGRRKPYLVAFTLACVGATALLGLVDGVLAALLVAGVAIFAYDSALAHYDPLLAAVAPPERRGLVSGLGVGVGYVGVLLALVVIGAFVGAGETQRAFPIAAALFLALSLPCFAWVGDRRGEGARPERRAPSPRSVYGELRDSVRRARREPYGRLLLARFLYVDAIATVGAYMTVYARRTGDFSNAEVDGLITLALSFALVGGLGAGALVERVGPKRVLSATVAIVASALILTALTGWSALLWVAGPAVGLGFGAVWTSDRVFLVRLCPERHRGEAFGLYALVGKASSALGPLVLWGATVYLLSDALALLDPYGASRVAVGLLACAALAGVAVLRPLSDAPS